MAQKKKQKNGPSESYAKFKGDLKAGAIGRAYLFYGPEAYLRERSLGELQRALVPPGFEAFNFHRLEGRSLGIQELADTLDGLPMMAERTLTVVTDMDLFKLNGDAREKLTELLSDLPEHCCLVFVYDTIPYEPNRTLKKLCQALKEHVETVEFTPAGEGELINWTVRHFAGLGKEIDRQTAQYLLFTCGALMANLDQEIQKIGSYAKGPSVTREDIDAVAIPELSAEVFRLTDAVVKRQHDEAAGILGDLLKLQTEPIPILAVLGLQMRRLYTARMAVEEGRDRRWLADLWGMHEYPAKLLLEAARRTNLGWCAEAVKQCQILDRRMKSERGIDAEGELKLLLVRLGGGAA